MEPLHQELAVLAVVPLVLVQPGLVQPDLVQSMEEPLGAEPLGLHLKHQTILGVEHLGLAKCGWRLP